MQTALILLFVAICVGGPRQFLAWRDYFRNRKRNQMKTSTKTKAITIAILAGLVCIYMTRDYELASTVLILGLAMGTLQAIGSRLYKKNQDPPDESARLTS